MATGIRWLVLVGLSVLLVSSLAQAEPSLSGSWSLALTIDPADPLVLGWTSSLEATYEVEGWSFASLTAIGNGGWSAQDFKASGSLGEMSLSSTLEFDPAAVAFKRWSSTASGSIDPLSLSATFEVTPNYVALDLSVDGETDALSLGVEIGLRSQGDCGLLFDGVDISFGFPYGCAKVSGELAFACDGFDEASFSVSDIAIPKLSWVTIDADLTFALDNKEVELSPSFDFGDFACFKLYLDVESDGNLRIGDISIYGVGLTCDIGEVSFESLSYVDGIHKLNGDYWEMYKISFDSAADCCGLTSGELAVYFLEGGAMLFDVGLLEGAFSVALNEKLIFDMGMTWDIQAGVFEELTLGFAVSW